MSAQEAWLYCLPFLFVFFAVPSLRRTPWKILFGVFIISHFFDIGSTIYFIWWSNFDWKLEGNELIQFFGREIGYESAFAFYAVVMLAFGFALLKLGEALDRDVAQHTGTTRLVSLFAAFGAKCLFVAGIVTRCYASYHNIMVMQGY